MILLDSSKYYSIYQDIYHRRFHVDFGQKSVSLSFCQLLALREKINAISVTSLFDSETNAHGLFFLTLCNNEHLFVLNILEVLDLKTLVQNSFAAMGLSRKIVPITA
ncbi:hypothetical protein [Croceitalea rosinachiae]|uniref:Uncharacterized protein n=1 Tax=Croceitalea rosinachiae TaxID=3075596 RepID=A0ABU3ACK1_9FLAO|nr:hypothetical protein [Croceitalea sp. F388]MDT0606646.1 hypothetical protein [Croceitalea sp. F388]